MQLVPVPALSSKSRDLSEYNREVRRLGAKGRPSMPGIEGRCEGRPLVPKRGVFFMSEKINEIVSVWELQ